MKLSKYTVYPFNSHLLKNFIFMDGYVFRPKTGPHFPGWGSGFKDRPFFSANVSLTAKTEVLHKESLSSITAPCKTE